MKNILFIVVIKSFSNIVASFLLILMPFCLVSCFENSRTDMPPLEVEITGNINHTSFEPGQEGSVTFNRFPASVKEFEMVRKQIGGEPHGAVALELMAAEIYRRDAAIGIECLKLCNTPININNQISRWKELFGKDEYYARPYQIASFLKGATPENKYTPTEPYTIEVKVNSAREYQNITEYQSVELYLEVLTSGKDKGSETVYVVKPNPCRSYPEGSEYFLVNNCPGLYSQVKEIFDQEWDKLK